MDKTIYLVRPTLELKETADIVFAPLNGKKAMQQKC